MNLTEDLKMLVAVAESGGIREGAKLVFKTQPAVSQAIKRLEHELEIEIYDRNHYRFALTGNGKALLKRAIRLLSEEERFKSYVTHLKSGVELDFHFAVQSTVDLAVYLDVFEDAQMQFPDTTFHIHQEEVSAAMILLMEDTVDLAINPWTPHGPSSYELETLKLEELELINVCHHLYFENSKDLISVEEAVNRHQIILSSNSRDSEKMFDVLEGNRRWFCNTQTMKMALIRKGMGWGKLPKKSVEALLKSGELVELNLEGIKNRVSGEFHLIRREKRVQGPVGRWLWQQFFDRSMK